ncbi:hypothetical protein GCM10022254_35850 [Actinomadura meridiana]|uniref:Uncharacterized protein n=1 Tax=Actinomadura meridiana TaxID=559626 RepID=A0ABP8C461_9ACTN
MSEDSHEGELGPFGQVDVGCYPDLVRQGGLVNALRAVVDERQMDIGSVDAPYGGKTEGHVNAKIETGRGIILARIHVAERNFSVNIHDADVWIAGGTTADISQVLDVAAAWREGISLDSLENRFPFMKVTDLARVLASPDPVRAQWDYLRTAPVFHDDRVLVDAAFGNAVLRSFFPDLSHRTLQLSRSFRDRQGAVRIAPGEDGYSVSRSGGTEPHGPLESLDRAIAVAAELLGG